MRKKIREVSKGSVSGWIGLTFIYFLNFNSIDK